MEFQCIQADVMSNKIIFRSVPPKKRSLKKKKKNKRRGFRLRAKTVFISEKFRRTLWS
jgi:hypothetical protein